MAILNRIGIVFALKDELNGLARVFEKERVSARHNEGIIHWSIGKTDVLAVVSGIGADRATQATRFLINRGANMIVCAGFAAGLDPKLQIGDVLVVKRVLVDQPLDSKVIECDSFALPKSVDTSYSVYTGDLVTWESIVRTPLQKRLIRNRTQADALDMESYYVGNVCKEYGIPFAVVRSISDTASDELPEITEVLVSNRNKFAQLAFVMSRPQDWPCMAKLRKQSTTAARNLGNYLGFIVLRTGLEEQFRP